MDKVPSPTLAERLERKRLAAEDGAKALKEVAERSIAVRQNMARLRALRLAEEAKAPPAANQPTKVNRIAK